MYSPTRYLESLIAAQLDAYIEDFDSHDNVSLGLLSGQINLQDLRLKKQSFPIGTRYSLQIDFATIDNADISVPWAQLMSGRVSATVENVSIICSLRELDLRDPEDHKEFLRRRDGLFDDKLKMVEDLIVTLDGDAQTAVIKPKFAESFASSLMARIYAGFSLTINNFSISLILPVSNRMSTISTPQVSVRFHVDSFIVNMGDRGDSVDQNQRHVLSKNVEILGVSISIERVDKKVLQESNLLQAYTDVSSETSCRCIKIEEYISFVEHSVPANALVDHFNIKAVVHLFQEVSSGTYHSNSVIDIPHVTTMISKSNLDALEVLLYISNTMSIREKYSHFVPSVPLTNKKWWLLYACGVIRNELCKKDSPVAKLYVKQSLRKELVSFIKYLYKGPLGDCLNAPEQTGSRGPTYPTSSSKYIFGIPRISIQPDINRIIQIFNNLSAGDILECVREAAESVFPRGGYDIRLARLIRAQTVMRNDPSEHVALNMLIEEKDRDRLKKHAPHLEDGVFNGVVFKTQFKVSRVTTVFSRINPASPMITVSCSNILLEHTVDRGSMCVSVDIESLIFEFSRRELCKFGEESFHAVLISYTSNLLVSDVDFGSQSTKCAIALNYATFMIDERFKNFLEFSNLIFKLIEPRNFELACLQREIEDLKSIAEKVNVTLKDTESASDSFYNDVLQKFEANIERKEQFYGLLNKYGSSEQLFIPPSAHADTRRKLRRNILHQFDQILTCGSQISNSEFCFEVNNSLISVANLISNDAGEKRDLDLSFKRVSVHMGGQISSEIQRKLLLPSAKCHNTDLYESYRFLVDGFNILMPKDIENPCSFFEDRLHVTCEISQSLFEDSTDLDNLYLSCECLPLKVALPEKDFNYFTESFLHFNKFLISMSNTDPFVVRSSVAPVVDHLAVTRLRKLCDMRILVRVPKLSISIGIGDEVENLKDVLFYDIFYIYGEAFVKKSIMKSSFKINRSRILRKLHLVGISPEHSKLLLIDFENKLRLLNPSDIVRNENNCFLGPIEEVASKVLSQASSLHHQFIYKSMFSLDIDSLRFNFEKTSYETSQKICFYSLDISTAPFCPIFSIQSTALSLGENDSNTLETKKGLLSATVDYEIKHLKIKDRIEHPFTSELEREKFVSLEIDYLNMKDVFKSDTILFETTNIVKIGILDVTTSIEQMKQSLDCASRLYAGLLELSGQTQNNKTVSENKTSDILSCHILISSARLVFIHKTLYFSEISIMDLEYKSGFRADLAFSLSMRDLKLRDLTEAGITHPLVIWKKIPTDLKKGHIEDNAILIYMTQDGFLDMTINFMHICIVYRFINEILEFKTDIENAFIKKVEDIIEDTVEEYLAPAFSVVDKEIKKDSDSDSDGSIFADCADDEVDTSCAPGNIKQRVKMDNSCLEDNNPNYSSTEWKVMLIYFVIILPRNSYSRDQAALKITECSVASILTPSIFTAPDSIVNLRDVSRPYVFDGYLNSWREQGCHNSSENPASRFDNRSESFATCRTSSNDIDGYLSDSSSFKTAFSPRSATSRTSIYYDEDGSQFYSSAQNPEFAKFRVMFSVKEADMFVALEPLGNSATSDSYGDVNDLWAVYRIKKEKESSRSKMTINSSREDNDMLQVWRKVSVEPFDMSIVIDDMDKTSNVNILICDYCDSEIARPFHLSLSMAELHVIESIYFDNLAENSQFGPYHQYVPPSSPSKVEYRTNEYNDILRKSEICSQFIFVRQTVKLECLIDKAFFDTRASDFPYSNFLPSFVAMMKSTEDDLLSFSSLNIGKLIIHTASGPDLSRSIVSACSVVVYDTQGPSCPIINIENNDMITVHAYSDAGFGIAYNESSSDVELDIPFKLTYFATNRCNWASCIIGIAGLTCKTKTLDPVWRISQFFGNYFQQPVFGHPGVSADKIENTSLSYSGLDVRCYITHYRYSAPSLVIVSENERVNLILQMKKGLFFQYASDSRGSVKMVCRISHANISLVGSNSGELNMADVDERVLAESLHVDYSNYFDAEAKTVETAVSITGHSSQLYEYDRRSYDFIEINCICPVADQKRPICDTNYEIRISVEDTILAADLVKYFLGVTEKAIVDENFNESDTSIDFDDDSSNDLKWNFTFFGSDVKLLLADHLLSLHQPLLNLAIDRLKVNYAFTPASLVDRTLTVPLIENGKFVPDLSSLWMRVDTHIDFFNKALKCFEPFLEPVSIQATHEKSLERGHGISFRIENNLHINFTSTFFQNILDIYEIVNKHMIVQRNVTQPTVSRKSHRQQSWIAEIRHPTRDGRDGWVDNKFIEPLSIDGEAPFSILNLTGQKIRYQFRLDDKKFILAYADHDQRGLLNFLPSKSSIVDCRVLQEVFDGVKASEKHADHTVNLQLRGFLWVTDINADALKLSFHQLKAIGKCNEDDENNPIFKKLAMYEKVSQLVKDKYVMNALHLASDVVLHNGGKMLRVRSTFSIKNETSHGVNLFLKSNRSVSDDEEGIYLPSGETYFVPTDMPFSSIIESSGNDLGFVWVQPSNVGDVRREAGDLSSKIQKINRSNTPISFREVVDDTLEYFNAFLESKVQMNETCSSAGFPLQCPVLNVPRILRKDALSPSPTRLASNQPMKEFGNLPHEPSDLDFFYCIEIQRSKLETSEEVLSRSGEEENRVLFPFQKSLRKQYIPKPCVYDIVIRPPFVIENLLPLGGEFELYYFVDDDKKSKIECKRSFWRAWLLPGQTLSIHTVDLTKTVYMSIVLCNCSSNHDILVHKPIKSRYSSFENDSERNISDGISGLFQGVKGFVDDLTDRGGSTHATLVDSVNQKLKIDIDNICGQGGGRHIVIFTPFWVLNTSQYTVRLRQEGSTELPAGTVSAMKDGSKYQDKVKKSELWQDFIKKHILTKSEQTLFLGQRGPLHFTEISKLSNDSEKVNLLYGPLSFQKIVNMAYMFPFDDEQYGILGAQNFFGRRISVQIDESEWSPPISLDLVGVNQVISIYHNPIYDKRLPEGGTHEISCTVSQAEGRLGKYTKIIRFTPRLILRNKLPFPVKIVAPASFFIETSTALSVDADHTRPFHIPLLFGGYQVSLQVEGPWTKTPGFPVDRIGSHCIYLQKRIDSSKLLEGFSRSKLAEYPVTLPILNSLVDDEVISEIGLYFETDWTNENVVVKNIKPGSWAAGQDIRVGDVLLDIDGKPLMIKDGVIDFHSVLSMIKDGINEELGHSVGPTLKFRTKEESSRIIRKLAANSDTQSKISADKNSALEETGDLSLKIDIKNIDSTIIVLVSKIEAADTSNPQSLYLNQQEQLKDVLSLKRGVADFVVKNHLHGHSILFKQKDTANSTWRLLGPCSQQIFVWDNPFLDNKIIVKLNKNVLCPAIVKGEISLESYTSVIDFNLIGSSVNLLDLDGQPSHAIVKIDSEGPSKILRVMLDTQEIIERDLKYSDAMVSSQIDHLTIFQSCVKQIHSEVVVRTPLRRRLSSLVEFTPQEVEAEMNSRIEQNLAEFTANAFDGISSVHKNLSQKMQDCLSCPSYSKFEDVLGLRISKRNQLFIEILQARDLPANSFSGLHDVFCKVYLKYYKNGYGRRQKTFCTNICEKTLNPVWENERFVFDIPQDALKNPRGYLIRVVVKSRTPFGVSNDLGQADVTFSSKELKDEKVSEGWLPLQHRKSTFTSSSAMVQDPGFLRVRMQWVHTERGLVETSLNSIDDRIYVLTNLKNEYKKKFFELHCSEFVDKGSTRTRGMSRQPYDVAAMAVSSLVQGGSSLVQGGSSLINSGWSFMKSANPYELIRRTSASERKNTILSKVSSTKSATTELNEEYTEASLDDSTVLDTISREEIIEPQLSQTDILLERISQNFNPYLSQLLCNAVKRPYSSVMRFISMKKALGSTSREDFPSKLDEHLRNDAQFSKQYSSFEEKFRVHAQRAFKLSHATRGEAAIMPIEVRNVPAWGNVFISVSYFTETKSTFSIPPATTLSWVAPEHIREKTTSLQKMLEKDFDIDTFNIRGPIRVSVFEDNIAFYRELAYVEIPVLRFIDCTCLQPEGEYYERYFPLIIPNSTTLRQESFFSMIEKQFTETEKIDEFGMFHNQPCIKLRLRWTAKSSSVLTNHRDDIGKSASQTSMHLKPDWYSGPMYMHTRVRRFSIAIIDDKLKYELMELTLDGIDYRISGNETCFDHSLNMDHLQIDNHLPRAAVDVILAQKPVRYQQPVLRFHATYNRETSHKKLVSFDKIELVIQELDLKLEQQTIIISWFFTEQILKHLSISLSHQKHEKFQVFGNLGFMDALVSRITKNDTIMPTDPFDEDKLYIDELLLCLIKINISFITTPATILSNFSNDINPEEVKKSFTSRNQRLLYSSITAFLTRVGEVVLGLTTSISDAPITLSGKAINHFFGGLHSNELLSTLQQHYLASALGQLYKIVGSLDLVGNPVALVSSLGTGVRDLFYAPAYAILNDRSIQSFTFQTILGALSMVSNTTDGTLGTATTMTRFVGKGFAALAMDKDFIENREALSRTPEGYVNYALRPVADIMNGLYCGTVGIVRVPYLRVKQQGVQAGLLTGIPVGVFGVLAKPMVGALDAATHTGDLLRKGAQYIASEYFPPQLRKRYSVIFGPDGRLLPYDALNSLGKYVMSKSRTLDAIGGMETVITESWSVVENIRKLMTTAHASEEKLSTENVSEEAMFNHDLKDDCIIYTANFDRSDGVHRKMSSLIIITMMKIDLVECKQSRNEEGVDFKKIWSCPHENIDSIKMNEKCVLDIHMTTRQHRGKSHRIQCNFPEQASLVRCHNVLQAIKGHFEEIVPFNDTEVHDEDWDNAYAQGYIRIGPWTFSARSLDRKAGPRHLSSFPGYEGDLFFDLNNYQWIEPSVKELRKGSKKRVASNTMINTIQNDLTPPSLSAKPLDRMRRAVSFADDATEVIVGSVQQSEQELESTPKEVLVQKKSHLASLFPFVDDPVVADEKEAPHDLFDYSSNSESSVSPNVSPLTRIPPQIPRYSSFKVTTSSPSSSPSRGALSPPSTAPSTPSYLGRDKFRALKNAIAASKSFERPRVTVFSPSVNAVSKVGGTPKADMGNVVQGGGGRNLKQSSGGASSAKGIEMFIQKHNT